MGFLRKIGKKIKRAFKKIGKKIKRAFGKVAKFFGKLGPLGSIALSFLLPGIGSAISGWFSGLPAGNFIKIIGEKMIAGAKWVKGKVGVVFNKVTDAIEYGMNAVSRPFIKEGARGMGSAFRDFVSDVTGGFIDPSDKGNIFDKDLALKTSDGRLVSDLSRDELKALGENEMKRLQQQAAAPRARASFLKENLEIRKADDFSDIKTKGGEKIINNQDGTYQVWKNEKAYDEWQTGKYGSTDIADTVSAVTPKPDESYSVLDGKPKDDMTTREFIGGSDEYSAYKKISAVGAVGQGMEQEEQMYASYLNQKRGYYTDLALANADQYSDRNQYGNAPRYPQASFVDPADFQIGQDLNQQYLSSIGYSFDPRQAQINAFDVGGYGFNFQDYVEAADARYGT